MCSEDEARAASDECQEEERSWHNKERGDRGLQYEEPAEKG